MKISKLDLTQFRKKIEDYIGKTGNEDKVLVFISSGGYLCFTKNKTTDEMLNMFWEHHPQTKQDFKTKKEFVKEIKPVFDGNIRSIATTWYFDCGDKKGVFICPTAFYNEGHEEELDNFLEYSFKDRVYGMFMDPYTYTGAVECDDDGRLREDVEYNNYYKYCVFCTEMSADEYAKNEKAYIDSIKTKKYDDGITFLDNGKFCFHEKVLKLFRDNTVFNLYFRDKDF